MNKCYTVLPMQGGTALMYYSRGTVFNYNVIETGTLLSEASFYCVSRKGG